MDTMEYVILKGKKEMGEENNKLIIDQHFKNRRCRL